MPRASVIAIGLLAGCMRIYPDPDLPDVRVEWSPELDCRSATDVVVATLNQGDPPAEVRTLTAPCGDGSVRFVDVPREQFLVAAVLEDTTGAARSNHLEDIDLRDGIGERVFAYFGGGASAFVTGAWTFDMGASCASLRADFVDLAFLGPDGAVVTAAAASCTDARFMQSVPASGTVTVQAVARSLSRVLAISPPSPPIELGLGLITDFGLLTMSPCGDACPDVP